MPEHTPVTACVFALWLLAVGALIALRSGNLRRGIAVALCGLCGLAGLMLLRHAWDGRTALATWLAAAGPAAWGLVLAVLASMGCVLWLVRCAGAGPSLDRPTRDEIDVGGDLRR